MQEFIRSLDEYFCEKYANYDSLCVLKGYKMPKMQTTEEIDGIKRSYTLPPETMRLALQENKEELLKEVKKNAVDKSFSFSFFPLNWKRRLSNRFGVFGFKRVFEDILSKKKLTALEIEKGLTLESGVFKKVCKGSYLPTKNLVLSIALVGELSMGETNRLLDACGEEWAYSQIKDTVVAYLLENKVFSLELIKTAMAEYKVDNLFIELKKEERA